MNYLKLLGIVALLLGVLVLLVATMVSLERMEPAINPLLLGGAAVLTGLLSLKKSKERGEG